MIRFHRSALLAFALVLLALGALPAMADPTITTGQSGDPTSVTVVRGGSAVHIFALPTGQNGTHNVTWMFDVQGVPNWCYTSTEYFTIVGVGQVGHYLLQCATQATAQSNYNFTVKAYDDVASGASRTFLVNIQ